VPMPGFGASDCGCEAHLFFLKLQVMRERIRDVLSAQGASVVRIRG
jgi:Uri superfamily endonuclease